MERLSAISALIRVKIFILSTIWDMITSDRICHVQKSFTNVQVSCKRCNFLALLALHDKKRAHFMHQLSCKVEIVQVCYTSKHSSWTSCNISKILTYLSCASFTSCKFLHHLRFWWRQPITGFHKYQLFLVVSEVVISLSIFMYAIERWWGHVSGNSSCQVGEKRPHPHIGHWL